MLQGPLSIESAPSIEPTTTVSSFSSSKTKDELQQDLEKANKVIAESKRTSDELQRQLEECSLEIREVKRTNGQLEYELDVFCLPCLTMVSQAKLPGRSNAYVHPLHGHHQVLLPTIESAKPLQALHPQSNQLPRQNSNC